VLVMPQRELSRVPLCGFERPRRGKGGAHRCGNDLLGFPPIRQNRAGWSEIIHAIRRSEPDVRSMLPDPLFARENPDPSATSPADSTSNRVPSQRAMSPIHEEVRGY